MRLRSTFAAALAVWLLPSFAHAENTEPFFYSDDAALTAGAVTATTRDAGAIWYNPAGLGGVRKTQIDLSGSALGLRIRKVPDAVTTKLPGRSTSLSPNSVDIVSAPHALGFVRNISDSVSIGFGLFVTQRDIRTAESEVSVTGPASTDGVGTATYRQRLDIAIDETRYHAGPALGWEISPGIRVGAALFATYGKQNGFAQYALDVTASGPGGTATGVVLSQNRVASSYFGFQAHVGAQIDLAEDFTLALLVRSPELVIDSSSDAANIVTSGFASANQPGQLSYSLEHPDKSLPGGTIVEPFRVVAAVTRRFAPRTWVAAEVDVQAPYSNQGLEGATVVNGRVGGRMQLSDRVGVGVGLFSDRATAPSLGTEFGDEQVDWYGISGGIELRTPLPLTGRDAGDPLVLSTTIGLKYALGVGTFRAADIDATSNATPPPREADVVYHSILPYFGSAVAF